jgi:hypothetical protein
MTFHDVLSFIKSGLRIIGCVFLPLDLVKAAICFGLAEGFGIAEEIPELLQSRKR